MRPRRETGEFVSRLAMEAPAVGLSPEMMSYFHRNFPTLLVALPQAARSVPGALLGVVRRFLRGMTRRRMTAVGVIALMIGLVELPRGLIEMRRRRLESIAAEHESKTISGMRLLGRRPRYQEGPPEGADSVR
jgi:hypothetical protein